MYTLKQIEAALKLLDQYDGQLGKTARELNINRSTLQSWRDKRKRNEPLLKRNRRPWSKWTKEQKNEAIEYYFSHGESVTIACRKLWFPTLKARVKELTSFIEGENERCINTEEFIKQVKKYTEFNKSTPEILNTFISKVLIHKTKIIDGKKHQEIEIYYNGIGKVQMNSQN